jgi:hypothetical protein
VPPDTTARARMPGLHRQTNLTLKHGVLRGEIFRVWNSALEKGRPVPGTLKIIPLDNPILHRKAAYAPSIENLGQSQKPEGTGCDESNRRTF